MRCNHMSRFLISDYDVSRLPLDAQEHLKNCRSCQDLIRALAAPASSSQPSSQTLHLIEQALTSDLRVVKPIAPSRLIFVSLMTVCIASVFVVACRLGAFGIAAMNRLQLAGTFGVLAIGCGLLIYSLVHQIVPGSRHRISPQLLPIGVVISLIFVILTLFQFHLTADFWARGRICLSLGLPVGCLAALPLWMVLRRGGILSPAMTGAVSGLVAGLVGTSVLEIHCPNLDGSHILVWHLGVAVLCSISGFAFGVRVEFQEGRPA